MWQVIGVTLVAGLAGIESVLDEWQWHRPILACTLTGLVLGNLHTGLLVGGVLELLALGWMNIGATQSPDTALASVIATILAIRGGHGTNQAIALAIPLAIAGNLTTVMVRTMTIYIAHLADRIAPQSNRSYLGLLHIGALSLQFLRVAVPACLFDLFVNRDMILAVFRFLPPVLQDGFTAASGFIVVVGYAMVIRSLHARDLMPYFFLGFLAADFTNVTLVAVGIIGFCIAWFHVRIWGNHASTSVPVNDGAIASTLDWGVTHEARPLPPLLLWRTLWRSQWHQSSWNYERMQGLGYAYEMEPTLDYLYGDANRRHERKSRHLEFFNTNPYVANLVLGMNMALEQRLSTGEQLFERLVSSIKLGMMGPLAGVGDSIFWGTIRPLLSSLGATLALQGNVFGPILFFVSWNSVRLITRSTLLFYGYHSGMRLVRSIASGVLRQLTEGAAIVGLFVMGALVADWAHVNLAVVFTASHGLHVSLANIIIEILPKLPNLLLVLLVLYLLRRGWSSIWVILLLFAMAIGGVWVHLLAA